MTNKKFTKMPVNDVAFTSNVLQTEAVRSRIDCGRRCATSAQCLMYTFWNNGDRLSGMCRLHGKIPVQGDDVTSTPGARSYGLADNSVPCHWFSGYSLKHGLCVHLTNQYMPYDRATQTCKAKDDGHLPHAKNLSSLTNWLNFFAQYGLFSAWMGADDLLVDGQFLWSDGTPLPASSPLWDPAEIDSYTSHSCVDVWSVEKKLYDYDCRKNFSVVCEKDL
ncbi:hypothetical protein ACOMHN_042527 [Nucella lapillus]